MTPHAALLAESHVSTCVVEQQSLDVVMVESPGTLRLGAE